MTTKTIAVNDIGTVDDFLAAIDSTLKNFDDGDLVEGIIVKVDRDEVLLDIGYKTEGVIPSRELSIKHDIDPTLVVKVGDTVEALVLQKEDKEGRLILSKKRAQYERAWGDIEKVKEADGVVKGTVIEVVKGGLILDIGLRGFLPASLVELRRVRDLVPYVGKTVQAKIIELDKNRNNVVLSRRAFLEETQKESRDSFLTNLKPGEVREGVVSSVVSFGAFVDLGGMDGLIHVSELSWKHVDHPSAVVTVGDKVTVQVLDVDFDRERISLSLKATQQDPWQEFAGTHEVGQLVYGRVTKLVPFGGFVQVGDGIEGLVHISEMSTHHVDAPEQVVTPGEELWVKIIDLDLARRRISLSIKQAAEGGELAEEYRSHFEIDEHGNWTAGGDDAEREAAWAEYYKENPEAAPVSEGEHAAAAVTAGLSMTGLRATNFSSGQGIAYMHESLYAAAGKHLTYVLNMGCRAMTKSTLNVHAGHDDYHCIDDTGFFQLFGKSAQEVCDLNIISHRIAELALTPGICAQDGFLTTHTIENVKLPELEFMKEYIGDPTLKLRNMMDPSFPIMSGVVQNQDSYMKGKIAQRNVYDLVPAAVQEAMDTFAAQTGRRYQMVDCYKMEDAEYAVVGMGGMMETAQAAVDYIRATMGVKVGAIHVTCFAPFPATQLVQVLKDCKAVTVIERMDNPLAQSNPLIQGIKASFADALTGRC